MSGSPPLTCRLDALSAKERERRASLFVQLQTGIGQVRVLEDGYQVSVDPSAMPPRVLEELVGYEARCCEFLSFSIVTERDALALRITGGSGVKAFLASEFGLVDHDAG